jgi:anti-anti-sigma factor
MDTVLPFNPAAPDAILRSASEEAVAENATASAAELGAHAGILILELVGEHDLSDCRLLATALRDAREDARVLVDLSRCTYMDLAAIGRLITTHKRLSARGGRLELFIPLEADAMWAIARRTALAACLTTHTTREDGIAALTGARDERASAVRRPGLLRRLRHAG